jgi:hypothetical protein
VIEPYSEGSVEQSIIGSNPTTGTDREESGRNNVGVLLTSAGNTKGEKYHCTVDLLFDWFGISCMTTNIFFFYLQNRQIQTSQTGDQRYSDTFPFSIP